MILLSVELRLERRYGTYIFPHGEGAETHGRKLNVHSSIQHLNFRQNDYSRLFTYGQSFIHWREIRAVQDFAYAVRKRRENASRFRDVGMALMVICLLALQIKSSVSTAKVSKRKPALKIAKEAASSRK